MLRPSMIVSIVLVATMVTSNLCGQEPAAAQRAPSADSVTPVRKNQTKELMREHRFWDKKNDWWFAGVGAARTLDYFSTLNMRRRGRQEILLSNDVVDNHAAFGAIEAASTGASIGVSYLFHRYGHHKLERWTSVRAYRTDDHGRGSELLPENG